MKTHAHSDKAAAALKALDEAWAYFTPTPKPVPAAAREAEAPVYAIYSEAA